MPNVQLPDGQIAQFPDNMSAEQIATALKQAPLPKPPSIGSALWEGLKQGAGDIFYGGAQIGARMLEEGALGTRGAAPDPNTAATVDAAVRAREAAYGRSPAVMAHPIAAGLGRVGGNVATTAPLLAAPGGVESLLGRLGFAAAGGAAVGAMQPATGSNFAREKVAQAGAGAAGGLAGGALGEAIGSTLGKAIAGNRDVDLLRAYRRVVKPSRAGISTEPALTIQDNRILSAADRILDLVEQDRRSPAAPHIQLTDAVGNDLPKGTLPQSLRQFAQALDQTKRVLFRRYDEMAQQAGGAGAQVDLAPAVQVLRDAANRAAVKDFDPRVAADANAFADRLAARGSYSTTEAQETIQHLNRALQAFWKNPTRETVSESSLLAPVVKTMRDQLDKAITTYQGPGYQQLRTQYGALTSVEKDVAGAVRREAAKYPGGMGSYFADLASSEEAMRGILSIAAGEPGGMAAIGRAASIRAAKMALKFVNDPNRAVMKIFRGRAASRSPVRQAIGEAARRMPPVGLTSVGGTAGGMTAGGP
jgi:hypothetical protein